MGKLSVDYSWDFTAATPLLIVTVSGTSGGHPRALARVIDAAHFQADALENCAYVNVLYDITELVDPLHPDDLMYRTDYSPKVARVAILGARSQLDQIAVQIMSAALRLPYEAAFVASFEEAMMLFENSGEQRKTASV